MTPYEPVLGGGGKREIRLDDLGRLDAGPDPCVVLELQCVVGAEDRDHGSPRIAVPVMRLVKIAPLRGLAVDQYLLIRRLRNGRAGNGRPKCKCGQQQSGQCPCRPTICEERARSATEICPLHDPSLPGESSSPSPGTLPGEPRTLVS